MNTTDSYTTTIGGRLARTLQARDEAAGRARTLYLDASPIRSALADASVEVLQVDPDTGEVLAAVGLSSMQRRLRQLAGEPEKDDDDG